MLRKMSALKRISVRWALQNADFSKSMKYNPFSYIKKETDIMKVADALIEGTTTVRSTSQDPFWLDAERLLYNALIGYIMKVGLEKEKNFSTMLDMINAMEIREDNDNFKNAMAHLINDDPIDPLEGILHHSENIDLLPGNIELSGIDVSLVNVIPIRIQLLEDSFLYKDLLSYNIRVLLM